MPPATLKSGATEYLQAGLRRPQVEIAGPEEKREGKTCERRRIARCEQGVILSDFGRRTLAIESNVTDEESRKSHYLPGLKTRKPPKKSSATIPLVRTVPSVGPSAANPIRL